MSLFLVLLDRLVFDIDPKLIMEVVPGVGKTGDSFFSGGESPKKYMFMKLV